MSRRCVVATMFVLDGVSISHEFWKAELLLGCLKGLVEEMAKDLLVSTYSEMEADEVMTPFPNNFVMAKSSRT